MSQFNYKTKGTRLIVSPVNEKDRKTKGGIIIPDNASSIMPQMAEIKAVGSDCHNRKWEGEYNFHEGDKIIFNKKAGMPIVIDGKDYLLIESNEVLLHEKK